MVYLKAILECEGEDVAQMRAGMVYDADEAQVSSQWSWLNAGPRCVVWPISHACKSVFSSLRVH